jgi:hypothetical protein
MDVGYLLDLLQKKVTSISLLVLSLWMLYRYFYWIFSCYLPAGNLSTVIQWLRLALCEVPSSVSPRLRTETGSVSETLYSLVIWMPDDGQSYVIHHRQKSFESSSFIRWRSVCSLTNWIHLIIYEVYSESNFRSVVNKTSNEKKLM